MSAAPLAVNAGQGKHLHGKPEPRFWSRVLHRSAQHLATRGRPRTSAGVLSKRATNKCLHSGETPNRNSDSLICTAQHTGKGQAKRPLQHCRSRGHADCAGAVAHVLGTRHVYKTLRMQRPSPQAATVCSSGCFVRRRVQHNQTRHLPHRRSCDDIQLCSGRLLLVVHEPGGSELGDARHTNAALNIANSVSAAALRTCSWMSLHKQNKSQRQQHTTQDKRAQAAPHACSLQHL